MRVVNPGLGTVSVDGTTITGNGTPASPLVSHGGLSFMGQTLTPPVLANFTTAVAPLTLTGASNGIFMGDAESAHKLCNVYITPPATPYAFRTLVAIAMAVNGTNPFVFLGFSDGTKYQVMGFSLAGTNAGSVIGWGVSNWTNSTTFSVFVAQLNAAPASGTGSGYVWLKVRDDGTNVYFYLSPDGQNFVQLYTIAKASGFLGASGYSRVCLGVDMDNGGLFGYATFLDFTQTTS